MKSKYYVITEGGRIRFKKWLIDQNISMSEFARRVGVSKNYISRIILGQYYITPRIRELFAKGGYNII